MYFLKKTATMSSGLCMDKHRAHLLASLAEVNVPRGPVFSQGVALEMLEAVGQLLGSPLVVKPVRAGSSFGVTRVTRPEQLAGAVEAAFFHDWEILLGGGRPRFRGGLRSDGQPRRGGTDGGSGGRNRAAQRLFRLRGEVHPENLRHPLSRPNRP